VVRRALERKEPAVLERGRPVFVLCCSADMGKNMQIAPARFTGTAQKERMSFFPSRQYVFLGFLFSMLPVFFMSLSNAKQMPNGEGYRKKLAALLLVWVAGAIMLASAILYQPHALYSFTKEYRMRAASGGVITPEDSNWGIEERREEAGYLIQALEIFAVILNLVMLWIVDRMARANERPYFDELKRRGVAKESSVLPVCLAGLILILGFLYGDRYVAKELNISAIRADCEGNTGAYCRPFVR
jgi:hypothetical protein